MSDDKTETKLDSPPIKMQVGTRTIEEKPTTFYVEMSAPEPEFKALEKKK